MRTVAILAVTAVALGLAGCKPKVVPTTNVEVTAPYRSGETLTPDDQPGPRPSSLGEPLDNGTSSTAGTTSGTTEPAGGQIIKHTIVKGDTYYSLARKYLGDGKRAKEIEAMNPQYPANKLPVGKELLIPPK